MEHLKWSCWLEMQKIEVKIVWLRLCLVLHILTVPFNFVTTISGRADNW